jgi:hypothetical protein
MVDAVTSRVRLRDSDASGPLRRVGTDAFWQRQRLAAAPQSGQLAPRTGDLTASPI